MRSIFMVFAGVVSFACATLLSPTAVGQVQVLDSVDAFGPTGTTGAILEMAFRDRRPRDADFERLDIAASPILACQRGVDQSLVCVVGTTIRYWPDTDDVRGATGAEYIPYFNAVDCKDPALKLDNRRPNSCTSVTVDVDGAFWIAGRKANTHSLFKVKQRTPGAQCEESWFPLNSPAQTSPELPSSPTPTYCAREYGFGRPPLEDVNAVDIEAAENFITAGPAVGTRGVLALEKREGVTFFPDDGSGNPMSPVEIVKTRSDWGLGSKETLTTATLLQIEAKDYLVGVTTAGRVLALEVGADGTRILPANLSHREIFKFPAGRTNGTRQCVDDASQVFGIRVSRQSQRVYISDRNCGQVVALEWRTGSACSSGKPLCLVNAREPTGTGSGATNVTLSTVALPTTDLYPAGISIVQGVGFNLTADCGFNEDGSPKACPFVGDGDNNGYNAAEISGVKVDDNGRSAMTVYQVIDIPDCRYHLPAECVNAAAPTVARSDIVKDGYLNVYPLLPPIVQDRIPVTELWISPRYMGQESGPTSKFPGKRTIDLFFGVTEPGVRFRETFDGLFDVDDLNDGTNNNNDLGCGGQTPVGGMPDLRWDAIVTVSEKYKTVKPGVANSSGNYDMLVNTDCFNPDRVSGARWSLYAYNLQPVSDGKDSYYATLIRELMDDLLRTQQQFACTAGDADENDAIPSRALAPSTCSSLTSKWNLAKKFIESCITDATYPKKDQAVSNCNSFNSQVSGYRDILQDPLNPVRVGDDPANRIGELIARTNVLQYIYAQHFLPSIPPLGFCDLPGATCPTP